MNKEEFKKTDVYKKCILNLNKSLEDVQIYTLDDPNNTDPCLDIYAFFDLEEKGHKLKFFLSELLKDTNKLNYLNLMVYHQGEIKGK